jgi:fructose-1,6-bisphosphatase/inositol monophosphatase family enzyme
MNEQHRSVAAPSRAEIVFSVTSGAVSTGVQVGGAAVVGAANGLAKGLWWLARKGAEAAVNSQLCRRAAATVTEAWSSATKAVEERQPAHRQQSPREEAD